MYRVLHYVSDHASFEDTLWIQRDDHSKVRCGSSELTRGATVTATGEGESALQHDYMNPDLFSTMTAAAEKAAAEKAAAAEAAEAAAASLRCNLRVLRRRTRPWCLAVQRNLPEPSQPARVSVVPLRLLRGPEAW